MEATLKQDRWVISRYLDGTDERADRKEWARGWIEDRGATVVSLRVVKHVCAFDCQRGLGEQGILPCSNGAITHDIIATYLEES